jgi:hypothetical protein
MAGEERTVNQVRKSIPSIWGKHEEYIKM